MKRVIIALFAVAASLLGTSCEKEIEFKGEQTSPRLTVSSQVEAGEPLTVYVATSIFFLADQKGGAAFIEGLDPAKGLVRCFVNGARDAVELKFSPGGGRSSLCFVASGYIPAPGDRIRLEAEFPGFPPVWAETAVPLLPDFEILSVEWTKMEPVSSPWFVADENYDYYEAAITLAVDDDASYDKYYFLQPVGYFENPFLEEGFTRSFSFSSNDIIFRQETGTDPLKMLESGRQYFSDILVKGKRHVFTITVSDVPSKEEMSGFWLKAAAVNESLYWYDVSYSRVALQMGGLFSEGVTLYSNVHGGYGIFCAASPVILEVDM